MIRRWTHDPPSTEVERALARLAGCEDVVAIAVMFGWGSAEIALP